MNMSFIHAIGVAVPPYVYRQDYAAACMKRWVKDRALQRMVHHVYRQSGIERRHSVLPDFLPGATPLLFHESENGDLIEPGTGLRNERYSTLYPALARAAVARALEAAPHIQARDISHIITVSCTGFCNPGPDLQVAREFCMRPDVQRYHLGFMGCYAAFPALRMADAFCRADASALVLVVCVELCSLHLQIKPTPDSMLANALFADGAAAALISARAPAPESHALAIERFATRVIPGTESEMAWTIGDRGFDMTLSSYIPSILGSHIAPMLAELADGIPGRACDAWAVHPGGVAILRAIEEAMGWPRGAPALEASYRILRDFGNMSSATILFVLADLLNTRVLSCGAALGALAFGPGLTVEFAALRFVGKTASVASRFAETPSWTLT
jgi:predicted naringenin-chalcone synthase